MANDIATERLTNALAMLRTELNEMRSKDVKLMKQFMTMNNSIQQLTKKQKRTKRNKSSNNQRNFKELFRVSTLQKINEDDGNSSSECEYDSDGSSDDENFRSIVQILKNSLSEESE